MSLNHQEYEYQSYFWLYAPVGDIHPKKEKKEGCINTMFDCLAKGSNPLAAKLGDSDHTHPKGTRHLTLLEQPRTQTEPGTFRYQPVEDVITLEWIAKDVMRVMAEFEPLKMGGRALEIIEKTNKLHLALAFNGECEELFTDFHARLREELGKDKVYDLYKEPREPRLFLARAYKREFPGVDIKEAIKSFNQAHDKFKTKPIVLDRIVLGQGLFDIHGKNLGRREVATLYFDGRMDWHCDNPFDDFENEGLILETRDDRELGRAATRRPPSPVS